VARLPGGVLLLVSLFFLFLRAILAAWCLQVLTCWRQELDLRARDKYAAFDQVSAELHQLQERCDAFDALADA
jgi:hypothetical protein